MIARIGISCAALATVTQSVVTFALYKANSSPIVFGVLGLVAAAPPPAVAETEALAEGDGSVMLENV